MNEQFLLQLPLHIIQAIRLYQAILESDYDVCIESYECEKFDHLKKFFTLNYSIANENTQVLKGIHISHKEPITCIGNITKPLVFPWHVIRHCKLIWPHSRNYKVSFMGLMTQSRKVILNQWLKKNFKQDIKEISDWSKNKPNPPFGLHITNSDRGRVFPFKAWDDDYYHLLGNSSFVLCPSGDYVWSYRFFEAILCGAIPIIEKSCHAYDGFKYITMDDNINSVSWSPDMAEENFEHAINMLTVSRDELNYALGLLLKTNSTSTINTECNYSDFEEWQYIIYKSAQQIRIVIGDTDNIIIADGGCGFDQLTELYERATTFMEYDGVYCGPPGNDDIAIKEICNAREAGARYFAIAAPELWMLIHYKRFAQFLRSTFTCIFEGQHAIVFDLR